MTQEGIYHDPSRDGGEAELKFMLTITLGNDAMQTLADVARAFANAVNSFSGNCDPLEELDGAAIRDVSGKTIGTWTVQEIHA